MPDSLEMNFHAAPVAQLHGREVAGQADAAHHVGLEERNHLFVGISLEPSTEDSP